MLTCLRNTHYAMWCEHGSRLWLKWPMGRSEGADVPLIWKPLAASKQVVRVDGRGRGRGSGLSSPLGYAGD